MAACSNPPAILMPYMKMGSLYDVLHNHRITAIPVHRRYSSKNSSIPTKTNCVTTLKTIYRLKMALQAAQGMAYLHSLEIVHKDLKSLNLLVDEEFNVQVSGMLV